MMSVSSLKIFVNDFILYRQVKNLEILQRINSISDWSISVLWQIRLSPQKCELLCISNKRSPPKYDYTINDSGLKWCSFVKYLGIRLP